MAKACKYIYKGKEYSEEELDDLLLEARANKYGDIVFELDEKEKNIIERRYFDGRTQMEVADEIGISQAQVSRLEKTALEHMKRLYK